MDYLVVHARHGNQRSRDPPHWELIGEVKAAAHMPVFGNGDVKTLADFVVGASPTPLSLSPSPHVWALLRLGQSAGNESRCTGAGFQH